MFDFDFAYSGTMQILLFIASCVTTFLFYYFTTNLILQIYGEKVSFVRKAFFVLCAGVVLNTFWIYGIYVIGGMFRFSDTIYNLVTVPNPVFAVLFYILGVKILGLSPYRSVRLLTNTYLFIMVIKMFHRVWGYIIFPQTKPEWNYLLDATSVITNTMVHAVIYIILRRWLAKSKTAIRLADSSQTRSLPTEILIMFLKASGIYLFSVIYPIFATENENMYLVVMFIMLLLVLLLSLINDAQVSSKLEIDNKTVHEKILNDVIDGFSGLRHDFNNILQTYGGYIATENYDGLKTYHRSLIDSAVLLNDNNLLQNKLTENPALASLLIEKNQQARTEQVSMRFNNVCDITQMYIEPIDLCRCVGNLVDNAIEAAKDSPKKWVSISLEEKADKSKLIIIANSTENDVEIAAITQAGTTSKQGHTGMGLNHTRKLLSKYPNCVFQVSYYDHEFTAYITLSAT